MRKRGGGRRVNEPTLFVHIQGASPVRAAIPSTVGGTAEGEGEDDGTATSAAGEVEVELDDELEFRKFWRTITSTLANWSHR